MGSLRVDRIPHSDSSPKAEAEVLTNVYAFIIKAYETRNDAEASSGENEAEGG